jgi:cell division protein FtsI (penicillin-binding protein 3)
LGFGFLLWFSLLTLRLVQLQVLEHAAHKQRVLQQNQDINEIPPKRGTIFDRQGRILAASTPAQDIAYRPEKNETRNSFRTKIRRLHSVLPPEYRISRDKERQIWQRVQQGRPFSFIQRQVPWSWIQKVKAADIPGIVFEDAPKRVYPQHTLAGHLLGYIQLNGNGVAGIEQSYNDILGGQAGARLDLRDAHLRKFQSDILKRPVPGKAIYLTVDEIIQYIALRRLRKAYAEIQPLWATVVISYPATGEILAMVNVPEWDPNHYPSTKMEQLLADWNRAVRHTYEPGSTIKVATFAAALTYARIEMDRIFDCSDGVRHFGRQTIRDHKKLGALTFPEVFIHSSNVGTTLIADEIEVEPLFATLKSMGFGTKTGIDLPAEENGILRSPEGWTKYSYASLSIGYEISVTPLQILQMANIVANDGLLIPLRVVRDIPQARGALPERSTPYKRVIQESTAEILTRFMTEVTRTGTGIEARLDGYSVAGKTGTARKFMHGSYSLNNHIASFVGFVPAHDPVISMVVVIDDPQGKYYGGDVAAPVFRDIAAQVLRHLRIPPRPIPQKTLLTADSRGVGR